MWTTGWRDLPARRNDITGEVEEPLIIQFAGSLSGLQEALGRKGWSSAARWAPLAALGWLTANVDATSLPVVPRLANGELPELTFVLQNDAVPKGSLLVFRLWAVELELIDGSATLPRR